MSVVCVPRRRSDEDAAAATGGQSQESMAARGSRRVGPLLYLFPGYLLLLVATEILSRRAGPSLPALGPLLYGVVLVLLLLHTLLCWDQPFRCLPLTLSLAPATRLLLFSHAVGNVAGLEYYLALGLPLVAVVLAALSLGLPLGSPVTPLRAGAALARRAWSLPLRGVRGLRAGWASPARERWSGLLGRSGRQALLMLSRILRSADGLALRMAVFLDDGWGLVRLGAAGSVCSLRERARTWLGAALPDVPLVTRIRVARMRAGTIAPPAHLPRVALACVATLALLLAIQTGVRAFPAGRAGNAGREAEQSPGWLRHLLTDASIGPRLREERLVARIESALAALSGAGQSDEGLTAQARALTQRSVGVAVRKVMNGEQRAVAGWPDARAATVEEVFPPTPTPLPWSPRAEARPVAVFPDACPAGGYENYYPWGVCTWYAKARRPDLPWFLGEYGMADNWGYAARACGFVVDTEPAAGAVIVFSPGANGASSRGHVGYVEEVGPGYVLISECNAGHDSLYAEEPLWWEAGHPCIYRRIPRERLDPGIEYIHGRAE